MKLRPAVVVVAWFVFGHPISASAEQIRVMSFNILQSGGNASNVGFHPDDFGESRTDEIVKVIRHANPHVVGIQEDDWSDGLLKMLGDDWNRAGSVYSRLPVTPISISDSLTVCKVDAEGVKQVVVVNCHWRSSPYGPYEFKKLYLDEGLAKNPRKIEAKLVKRIDKSAGRRGYDETVDAIKPWLKKGYPVVLTGDFNEPSHLDWTARYEKQASSTSSIKNRYVSQPLRIRVQWPGSTKLYQIGLQDAYRTVHPDEVKSPGNTWTPYYPPGTPNRLPLSEQVMDRIDAIYYSPKLLKAKAAMVVGENKENADLVPEVRWPSDHRAVIASFIFVKSD